MQLNEIPEQFYVCRDCNFVHTTAYDIDKCPYCKSDDWIEYKAKYIEEQGYDEPEVL